MKKRKKESQGLPPECGRCQAGKNTSNKNDDEENQRLPFPVVIWTKPYAEYCNVWKSRKGYDGNGYKHGRIHAAGANWPCTIEFRGMETVSA